ncbi:MAG TPA: hypothetical protein VFR90_11625 [Methylibium sp.]|uniref:hypothetical protein n=1 Tax=Methylibium sp. TaxID=2067992 RepID=UPI002DB67E81|nr:hypothetical protein [Methylibium sp.]HEU4459763.1 hypothetical protein [Methylibium sp.]
MQQGEYRRAIAFVAHTAQAHRQVVGGALLYAWLLSRGAQDVQALRMLDGAAGIDPDAAPIARVRELIGPSSALPAGALLAPPLRLAPYASGVTVPRSARVAGSAVLLEGGRQALTAAAALRGTRELWLRNGLGQTAKGRVVEPGPGGSTVALIELATALPAGGAASAPRDPFPGSPGSVLVHRPDPTGAAAWPRLHAGFHGMPDGASAGVRRLGIDVPGPAAVQGAAVFDAGGRWAGVALTPADGAARVVMRSALQSLWPRLFPAPLRAGPDAPVAPSAGFDETYERGLRIGLQLIVRS